MARNGEAASRCPINEFLRVSFSRRVLSTFRGSSSESSSVNACHPSKQREKPSRCTASYIYIYMHTYTLRWVYAFNKFIREIATLPRRVNRGRYLALILAAPRFIASRPRENGAERRKITLTKKSSSLCPLVFLSFLISRVFSFTEFLPLLPCSFLLSLRVPLHIFTGCESYSSSFLLDSLVRIEIFLVNFDRGEIRANERTEMSMRLIISPLSLSLSLLLSHTCTHSHVYIRFFTLFLIFLLSLPLILSSRLPWFLLSVLSRGYLVSRADPRSSPNLWRHVYTKRVPKK